MFNFILIWMDDENGMNFAPYFEFSKIVNFVASAFEFVMNSDI